MRYCSACRTHVFDDNILEDFELRTGFKESFFRSIVVKYGKWQIRVIREVFSRRSCVHKMIILMAANTRYLGQSLCFHNISLN